MFGRKNQKSRIIHVPVVFYIHVFCFVFLWVNVMSFEGAGGGGSASVGARCREGDALSAVVVCRSPSHATLNPKP